MTSLKEQIVALRNEGLNYRQIQERIGCSKSVISYHVGHARVFKEPVEPVSKEPITHKVCRSCKVTTPLEDLIKVAQNTTTGRGSMCKKCESLRVQGFYKRNPSIVPPSYVRHRLTQERYEEMLAKHDGLCWSCQKKPATRVDHDHACCPGNYSCGACVRGLLCQSCNAGIGLLGDDLASVSKAVVYLKKFNGL